MADLIDRQAAIDAADRADYTGLTVEDVKKVTDEVVKELKQLPPAQPEPQWTPVKKGYPTESGYYNVTIMGYLDDRLEPAVEYYSPNTARDKKRWKAINVIAWRPADVYRE